jgi:cytochrome c nitrite reductase small subunit
MPCAGNRGQRMKRLIGHILPPPGWRLPVLFVLGVLSGLALLTLYVSNAVSYLSDKPETCVNCHVMAPQYATWQHGSHGRVTTCNDCHVPHDTFVRKYLFKARDGLRHASMFTLRLEPQVIRIKEAGIGVVQENCIRCHGHLVDRVSLKEVTAMSAHAGDGPLCWSCHRETPHGRVNSLASTPYARVPYPATVIPDWLRAQLQPSAERGDNQEKK